MVRFTSALLIVALVVVACGAPPDFEGWCYTFIFDGGDRTPAGLTVTEGTITDDGIAAVDLGGDLWSIIFDFQVTPIVHVDDIKVEVRNLTDPLDTVSAATVAEVFGQDAEIQGDLPDAVNVIWVPNANLQDFEDSNSVSVVIQADGPISVYSLNVGGLDGVSPFGPDDCAPATATPSATITPTATITNTPEPTNTPTPITNTPTPSPTPEPVCVTDWEIDLSNYSSTSLTPSDTSREYWQFDLGSPVEFYIDSPWPGYEFSVSGYTFRAGSYFDGSTNGYSAEGIRVYLWLNDGSVDAWAQELFPTGGSNGADKVTDTLDGGDAQGIYIPATGSWGTWAVPKPNPRGFRFQEQETSNVYSLDELVWVTELKINACRGDYIGEPTATPTNTPTITNTPTPTPTRTPIGGIVITPGTSTGPTPWPFTLMPTQTFGPPPTVPPVNSPTPAPTATPFTPAASWTPQNTLAPPTPFEPTLDGVTVTALPSSVWSTPDGGGGVDGTPQPGPYATDVMTSVPTIDKGPVYDFLATAAAGIEQLPGDLSDTVPDAGSWAGILPYVKWMISGISLQELLGPTLAPIGVMFAAGFTVLLFMLMAYAVLRIVLFALSMALAIAKFIRGA